MLVVQVNAPCILRLVRPPEHVVVEGCCTTPTALLLCLFHVAQSSAGWIEVFPVPCC